MARTYLPTAADVTALTVGVTGAAAYHLDYDATGSAVTGEALTVPASADSDGFYQVLLDQVPAAGSLVVTRTSDAQVLTQVAYSATPTANQVGVKWEWGVLKFPAAKAGIAHTADYTGTGSPVMSTNLNQLRKDVNAV